MNGSIDWEQVLKEAQALAEKFPTSPPVLTVICGSGLGDVIAPYEERVRVPYTAVPVLGQGTVEGHASEFFWGSLPDPSSSSDQPISVLFCRGRRHAYEGVSSSAIAFPVVLTKMLGCKNLLITASSGAVSEGFRGYRGLARISDHIDCFYPSVLSGPVPKWVTRFPATAEMYNGALGEALRQAMQEALGKEPREGVYAAVCGPNYESAAVRRMLGSFGDFAGMSTVPEALVAAALGDISVAAITNVTNDSGLASNNHVEVGDEAGKYAGELAEVITRLATSIS